MTENIALRFNLAHRFAKMRYGDYYHIDRFDAFDCWPPTGNHDHSIEGAMRAMALAFGGNRPETSYTTLERIQRDLPEDGSFVVDGPQPFDGSYIVHRKVSACPKCRGSGVKVVPLPRPIEPIESANLDMVSKSIINQAIVECDHKP